MATSGEQTTVSSPEARAPTLLADGRYRVGRFLGCGASKQVFAARDTVLERDVAISMIPSDAALPARLERETRALARLGDHPHVVAVHDIGEAGAYAYVVCQYLPGGSVADRLRESSAHRLPVPEAVRIARDVSVALEHAHAHGFVHRDVKPGNVLLAEDGTALLGDFGLALTNDGTRLTTEGTVLGTVGYMPPEQATGARVDERSDLYALGAMLFEMLAGRPPFIGATPTAVIAQILHSPCPRLATIAPHVPAPLDALVGDLLARAPEARPATAGAVREALDALSSRAGVVRPLPGAPAPMIGRDEELEAVAELCRSGAQPIVTIIGPGGVGKTRLAIAVGRAVRGDFPDGVVFVPLEGLRDFADVPAAIATAMGLSEDPDQSRVDQLRDHVRRRRMLLVLDNAEHVLDAAGELATIIGDGALSRMLVTSQAPLRLRGERVARLAPLTEAEALVVLTSAAVRADPEFSVTAATGDATLELCRLVGGIPLALELAGARLAVLGPAELSERLRADLDALGRGPRDLPSRQRGLRAALDWTTSELAPGQRRLLVQIAAFANGFSLRLAELAGEGDVLEDLAALVDLSLIYREGASRYAMPPPVRLYAFELMREGALEEHVRSRHAHAMLTFVEDLAPVAVVDAKAFSTNTGAERENIREAARWLQSTDADAHARLVCAVTDFGASWYAAYRLPYIDAALADAPSPVLRARLLVRRAYAVAGTDALGEAEIAVDACRELGDSLDLIDAINCLASEHSIYGDKQEAMRLAAEATAIAERLDDPTARHHAALISANAFTQAERLVEARRAIETLRRAPPRGQIAILGGTVSGDVALAEGDAGRALAEYCAWLRANRGVIGHGCDALQIDGVAIALARLGRHAEAIETAAVSDRIRDTYADRVAPAWLAFRDEALGDASEGIEQVRARTLDDAVAWVIERAG
jgi:non-specific serine/threonine protein kinase